MVLFWHFGFPYLSAGGIRGSSLFCAGILRTRPVTYLLASIRYGIAFLLGYAGMWVSKWILASLFTDENVIAEGIESVLHRTGKGAMSDVDSAFNVEIDPAAAMRENLHAFGTRPVRIMVFLLLCAAVVLVIYMIRHKAGFTKRAAGMFVIFALLTIIPIVWIVALNNHCSLHPHLEWREWLVAVFCTINVAGMVLDR